MRLSTAMSSTSVSGVMDCAPSLRACSGGSSCRHQARIESESACGAMWVKTAEPKSQAAKTLPKKKAVVKKKTVTKKKTAASKTVTKTKKGN